MISDLAVASLACLALLTLADFYLLVHHLTLRAGAVARERLAIATGSTADAAGRRICVQLPVFDEPGNLLGAMEAARALDWPEDLLEIQVLDDSIRDSAVPEAEFRKLLAQGTTIRHLHRADRTGYKAGALQAGLEASTAEHIAIFDVDFRPCPDFLRAGMAVLAADPRLAFVQARLDYRNRTANWLTRGQALEQDVHFAYEQAARNWSGVPMIFNGTCAIWRRRAIEQAGGWSGRTLGEDQDLSYRAFAAGWNSAFMLTVSARGELPESVAVLVRQRARWGTAAMQVARGLPAGLYRRLAWHQAAAFRLLALFNTMAAFLLVLAIGLTALGVGLGDPGAPRSGWCLLGSVAMIVTARTLGAVVAARALHRPIGAPLLADIAAMWMMHALLVPTSVIASIRGLFLDGGVFVRTPKGRAEA